MSISKIISEVCRLLEENSINHSVNSDGTISTELSLSLMQVPKIVLRHVEENKIPDLKTKLVYEGQKLPIVLKPVIEVINEAETIVFYIYDGLHRKAAMDQLFTEKGLFSTAKVLIDENATLKSSIVLNLGRVTQKPAQVARAIEYLINQGQMTLDEISQQMGMPTDFVDKHFSLNLLSAAAFSAMENGEITFSVALELAKMEKTASGQTPFSQAFKDEMLLEALGKGQGPTKATPEYLSSLKTTKRKAMNLEARGQNTKNALPQYKHTEIFSNDRWQETVSLRDSLLDSVQLDGHILTDNEKELIRIVDYVMTSSEEDRRLSREKFEENMKKITGVLKV